MAKSRTPDNLQLELRESPSDGTIDAVARIEHEAYRTRSRIDHLAAAIMRGAGTGTALFVHATWFSFWVSANLGVLPGIKPFDPFPFVFLATVLSLEAIFLTLFVLITQNRMSREADKRAQLDLQVNLLAEKEATMILRMLRDISAGLRLEGSTDHDVEELLKETKIGDLAKKLETALPPE